MSPCLSAFVPLCLFLSVVPSYGFEKPGIHEDAQGISAIYKDGRYQEVINLLDNKPSNEQSALYLGLSHLRLKNLDQTISVWKEYAKTAPGSETTRRLSQYITPLLRESAKEGAKKAIQDEKNLQNLDPNIVAVSHFQNKGSSEYDSLATGFAEMVITDLSYVSSIKVVERIRMQALINELKLSQSGLVDLNTAPQIGKLLGAGRIISGVFWAGAADNNTVVQETAHSEGLDHETGAHDPMLYTPDDASNETLRINLSIVQTQEGKLLSEKESFGTLQEFYKLEKSLVVQVLCGMGRCPESLDEQTQAALNKVHTTSFKAFLQYSKGLELRDQGRYREARQAFLQALDSDPQFHLSQEKLLETPLFSIPQEVVFSEENNLSDNEKPIGEMPLSHPRATTDGEGNEEKEEKEEKKPEREKSSSVASGRAVPHDDNSPLLKPEGEKFPLIFPIEQQPPTILVPVGIKMQF